ncbi:MAG: hypothetical protein DWH74_00285 [Planctomycetota bacterium]|nr:MAG: hypothetical protein DWH74_00285 [Planctomycetota bacterium]
MFRALLVRHFLRYQPHDQDWLILPLINPADFVQEFLLQPSFDLFLLVLWPRQPSPTSELPSTNLYLYRVVLQDH